MKKKLSLKVLNKIERIRRMIATEKDPRQLEILNRILKAYQGVTDEVR